MRFVYLMVFALCGPAIADDLGEAEGRERLDTYDIGASSSLGDYLCERTVSVISDPSAPILATANSVLVLARFGDDGYEAFKGGFEILDGKQSTRDATVNGMSFKTIELPPPIFKGDFEIFRIGGKPYLRYPGQKITKTSEPHVKLGGSFSDPFAKWPLMTGGYLRRGTVSGRPGTPVDFLKSWPCVSCNKKDGRVVAVFATNPKDRSRCLEVKVTFEDELIVRSEWVSFFVQDNQPYSQLLADVSTEWDKTLPDPLPVQVNARLNSESREFGILNYTVDFKWIFSGERFDTMKNLVQEAAREASELPASGAEDLKSAAPKN